MRIAADVGGTFTDMYAIDDARGLAWSAKVETTPCDSSLGIIAGLRRILEVSGLGAEQLDQFVYGSTVATNAAIQRIGAVTALVTTRGFRDVLEIGRQKRPHLYDLTFEKEKPLVPRDMRFEVSERVLSDGEVLTPLNEDEVKEMAETLRRIGVEAVAVSFLHAYRYPKHEEAVVRILRDKLPGVYICSSSEVLPEFREYERTTTTVLNAYLGPIVESYVGQLKQRLNEQGMKAPVSVVQSNGGIMSADVAAKKAAFVLLSGPSAGVAGAARIAQASSFSDVITFDMGGTSTDVALVVNGRVPLTSSRDVAGLPCGTSMVDVETVGAGGGSIAWVDSAGALKVGPRSVGADPGPAAYCRGGSEATVTDANLVLGCFGVDTLLGGTFILDPTASARAINDRVAKRLDMGLDEAALGIIRVANANMVRAVRVVSIQRGFDPRHFTLVAFGGAGPMHAVAVARELGMKTVLVPPSSGVLCAVGMLTMDVRTDSVRTLLLPATEASIPAIRKTIDDMVTEAQKWLRAQNLNQGRAEIHILLDMRYKGQNYELQVTGCDPTTSAGIKTAVEGFHRVHQQAYGYFVQERPVEVVNVRLALIHPTGSGREIPTFAGTSQGDAYRQERMRNVFFLGASKRVETRVLWRPALKPGQAISGPAVIESPDTAIVVSPGAKAIVDRIGSIVIDCQEEGSLCQ